MLTGFGQSALACLLDAPDEWTGGGAVSAGVLLASGGVRNPYDVVKALACGARAVGAAGTFLQTELDQAPSRPHSLPRRREHPTMSMNQHHTCGSKDARK